MVTGEKVKERQSRDWRLITCLIGSESIQFLIDTGSTVNTVTVEVWEDIKRNCRSVIQGVVMKPEEVLRGYASQKPLHLECSFTARITTKAKQRSVFTKFFVVDGTQLSLLSYRTAEALKLIKIEGDDYASERVNYATLDDIGNKLSAENEQEFPKIPI